MYRQVAFKLLSYKSVEKPAENRKVMMNNPKILESEVLLNLVSHKFVAWTFIKIFTAYKYVGLFV